MKDSINVLTKTILDEELAQFGRIREVVSYGFQEIPSGTGGSFKRPLETQSKGTETYNGHHKSDSHTEKRVKKTCQGCGREDHSRGDCRLKEHPDYNHTGEWIHSSAYKALASLGYQCI